MLNEIGIIIPNLQIMQGKGSSDYPRLYNQQVTELGFNPRHTSPKKEKQKTRNKKKPHQPTNQTKNPAPNPYPLKEQYLVL